MTQVERVIASWRKQADEASPKAGMVPDFVRALANEIEKAAQADVERVRAAAHAGEECFAPCCGAVSDAVDIALKGDA